MASIINASSTGAGGIIQTADASGVLQLQSNGTVALTTNGANIGIGTVGTMPTWGSSPTGVLQVGGSTVSAYGGEIEVSLNAYYNAGWKYIANGFASQHLQTSGAHYWYTAANNTSGAGIGISDFASAKLTLNINGALSLFGASASATGVGITFPATQSASTDANTLDDYEEGTFTPAFAFATSGSVSYGTQTANYIKIGRLVQCTIALGLSAISSPSGAVTITGLPFNDGTGENFVSAFSVALSRNFASALTIAGYIGSASTVLQISKNASNTGFSALQGSDLTSSTQLYVTLTYMTA